AIEQTVWLYERNGRQRAVVDGVEEVDGVLDVRGALCRVPHDGVGVGLEVANVAVGSANQNRWVGGRFALLGDLLELHGGVVGTAIVGPRNAFVVERFTDRTGIDRRDGFALRYVGGVDSAVRQEARVVVVDHVEVAGDAVRIRMIGQRSEVVANRVDAGLSAVAALGEVTVETQV